MIVQNSRLQNKFSTITGVEPTIPTTDDHTDGTWLDTDIYVGEIFINVADDLAWLRTYNGIIPITGASGAYIGDFVSASLGGTFSGDVYGTSFEAPIIESTSLINAVDINISGTATGVFVGDGSGLTGIVATWDGGTASLPTYFLDGVDFSSGILTDSIGPHTTGSINITSDVDLGSNDLDTTGNITASQFIGDGSLLTGITGMDNDYTTAANLIGSIIHFDRTDLLDAYSVDLSSVVGPQLSSVLWNFPTNTLNFNLTDLSSLDVILDTFGDTTFNGTVTADFFVGDGSGLTGVVSVPSGLSDVLAYGNQTGNNDIEIVDGQKIFSNYTVSGSNIDHHIGFGDLPGYLRLFTVNNTTGKESRLELAANGALIVQVDTVVAINTPEFAVGDIAGGTSFPGIQYNEDYSSNFTNRTLVDKEYVDNAITGSTLSANNGLTLSAGNIKLGGSLVETTTIDTATFDFKLLNSPTSPILNSNIRSATGELNIGIGVNSEYADNVFDVINLRDKAEEVNIFSKQYTHIGQAPFPFTPGDQLSYTVYGNGLTTNYASDEYQIDSPILTITGNLLNVLNYSSDLSVSYTNRSLVDKEYVDNAISGVAPSLSDVLLVGNTTDGSNIVLEMGDKITSGFGDPHSIAFNEGTINIDNDFSANREGRIALNSGPSLSYLYNRQYDGGNYSEGKLEFNNSTTKLNVLDDANGAEAYITQDLSLGFPTQTILSTDATGKMSQVFVDGTGYFNINVNDLDYSTDIAISPTTGFIVTTENEKGIEYAADYSATFTNRSLVDKEYVDNGSLPLSGTLTVNIGSTSSSHPFSGYRVIGKSNSDNKQLDFIAYIPKRSSLAVPLGILPGSFVLATVPLNDSSSDFFEFKYNARKTTTPYGREVGTITAFYDSITDTVEFSRTGPVAIGDVTGLDFDVIKTGATLQLTAVLTGTSDWEFYAHTTAYQSGFVE